MNNFYYKECVEFIDTDDVSVTDDIQNKVMDMLVKNSAVGVISGFYDEDYSIYFISWFALANLGYDMDTLKVRCDGKYINLICPSDRNYYRGMKADNAEYRLINSEGEYIWIKDCRVDYITKDGRNAWISSIRVVQNEHNARREFISTISHDIRTPLNVITGMAKLARANISSKDKVLGYIDEIINSSEQFMYQISEVLDMNELSTTVAHLEEKECSLRSVTDRILKDTNDSISLRKQNIIAGYNNITDDKVIYDEDNIVKVLESLIYNASEYSAQGSDIHFTISQFDSAGDDSRNDDSNSGRHMVMYEFQVRDNGIGIPYSELGRLFEPFERIQDTRNTKGSLSMGLGLAVAHNIVELMGGTIDVMSEENKGSVFTVKLPLAVYSKDDAADNAKLDEPSVLIVEDNEKNAEILQEYLKLNNIKSDIAFNGENAVDLFDRYGKDRYSIILMDIHMPVMNGYEAARKIRTMTGSGGDVVPIVAVTADSLPEDINEELKCGMNGHLSKPVDLEQLVKVIRTSQTV